MGLPLLVACFECNIRRLRHCSVQEDGYVGGERLERVCGFRVVVFEKEDTDFIS